VSQLIEDAERAADWIAEALSSSGYRADYSLDSLREIDRFFDAHSRDGEAVPGGLLSEQLGHRLFALGSYVGEVIRRHHGGVWRGDDGDPHGEVDLELVLPGDTILWPIQRVMKRFRNGPEDGIHAYGLAVTSQAGAAEAAASPSASRSTTRIVSYRLEPRDAIAIHRMWMTSKRRVAVNAAVLVLVVGAGLGWVCGAAAQGSRAVASTVGATFGVVLYSLLLWNGERLAVQRWQKVGLGETETLTIGPDGVERAVADGRTWFTPWGKVRKVGKTPAYFAIVLDIDETAIVVPLRAFDSPASADLFMRTAHAWHAKATEYESQPL
jgi:hypothetical protein